MYAKNLISTGGIFRYLQYVVKNQHPAAINSHLTNNEILISHQLVITKVLVSLQKQQNVDFMRPHKLKNVDFPFSTMKT